jgi:hypothetical protein
MGQPPGLIAAQFPKTGRTGSFRFAELWEIGWEVGSTRKVPGPKIKTEIISRLA